MKYKGTTDVHFEIKKAGSIVLFEPLTEWASEWWEENVEDSQMIGGAYAVEHRYAEDIATGITEALTQRLSAEPRSLMPRQLWAVEILENKRPEISLELF